MLHLRHIPRGATQVDSEMLMSIDKRFQLTIYGPLVAELLSEESLPELGPGQANQAMATKLRQLTTKDLFAGQTIVNRNMADCCVSGLWLWHDFLDESHTLSQAIETPAGSYWHGIMHRREPDYFNAKYWFRRVGQHAIFPALAEQAVQLASVHPCDAPASFLRDGKQWDPYAFIDLCEAIANGKSQSKLLAQHVARVEWKLLFDDCWQNAIHK